MLRCSPAQRQRVAKRLDVAPEVDDSLIVAGRDVEGIPQKVVYALFHGVLHVRLGQRDFSPSSFNRLAHSGHDHSVYFDLVQDIRVRQWPVFPVRHLGTEPAECAILALTPPAFFAVRFRARTVDNIGADETFYGLVDRLLIGAGEAAGGRRVAGDRASNSGCSCRSAWTTPRQRGSNRQHCERLQWRLSAIPDFAH